MQRLRIRHSTEYTFFAPVTINRHRLLLRPREGHDVRIESSLLDIAPAYSIKWYRDVFDNSLAVVDFLQPAQTLTIVSEVVIQHYEDAPTKTGVSDYVLNVPISYAPEELSDLAVYQQPVFPKDQPALQSWLQDIGLNVDPQTDLCLHATLNRAIHDHFRYRVREEVGVQSPHRTLDLGSGSCRDYATLFIEACRCLGLASRFVSGYLHAPATEIGNASTHAWAEVYLPGIGWQGFDPTIGETAGNCHIAAAVARNPETVPPISGSYIGPTHIRPQMRVAVQVNLLS